MEEEKITLDRETFKTLASGTRVEILKTLDRRRKTLSELSKQFGMSVSTVKEHLDNLVSVGLIEQKDEGHKWKYYELTRKGKSILHPEDKRIWILLSVSAIALIGIGYDFFSRPGLQTFAAKAGRTAIETGDKLVKGPLPTGAGESIQYVQYLPEFPYLHIIGFIIFAVILGLCVSYLILARRRMFSGL